MKGKRALFLFGSLAVLSLGYVAWCARSLYLSVPIPELLELPEEHRAEARAIIAERGLNKPDSFELGRFINLLARPYESSPGKVMVNIKNPHHIAAYRKSPGQRHYRLGAWFVRYEDGGAWHLGATDINGKHQEARPLHRAP